MSGTCRQGKRDEHGDEVCRNHSQYVCIGDGRVIEARGVEEEHLSASYVKGDGGLYLVGTALEAHSDSETRPRGQVDKLGGVGYKGIMRAMKGRTVVLPLPVEPMTLNGEVISIMRPLGRMRTYAT